MNLDRLDEAFTAQPVTAADVIAALAVLGVGVALALLVGIFLHHRLGRPGKQSDQLTKLAGRVGQWAIVAIALAWALSILGLDIGGLLLFILLALFVVALAIKPVVESFAIRVVITACPAFGVGDEIGIGAIVGKVMDITQRSVVVRQRNGSRLHIPNADVISEIVTVYSTDVERRPTVDVEVDVKLAYDSDIVHADQVIRSTLSDVDGVSRLGPVRATSLNQCVALSIRFWHESSIDAANQISDAVVRAVHTALGKAGIKGAPSLEMALGDPVLPDGTTLGVPDLKTSDHDAQ